MHFSFQQVLITHICILFQRSHFKFPRNCHLYLSIRFICAYLCNTLEQINIHLSKNNDVIGCCVDISKAFDRIWQKGCFINVIII